MSWADALRVSCLLTVGLLMVAWEVGLLAHLAVRLALHGWGLGGSVGG